MSATKQTNIKRQEWNAKHYDWMCCGSKHDCKKGCGFCQSWICACENTQIVLEFHTRDEQQCQRCYIKKPVIFDFVQNDVTPPFLKMLNDAWKPQSFKGSVKLPLDTNTKKELEIVMSFLDKNADTHYCNKNELCVAIALHVIGNAQPNYEAKYEPTPNSRRVPRDPRETRDPRESWEPEPQTHHVPRHLPQPRHVVQGDLSIDDQAELLRMITAKKLIQEQYEEKINAKIAGRPERDLSKTIHESVLDMQRRIEKLYRPSEEEGAPNPGAYIQAPYAQIYNPY